MFHSLIEKSKDSVNVILSLIDAHENISNAVDAEERKEIKIFSQASSLTRLYAIYEGFINKILSDYLDVIASLYNFDEMSEGFKNDYRLGMSHVLSRIEQGRYSHLKHKDVVNRYYNAINNHHPYQFVNDALVRHEQNFRLNVLETLLSRVGLEGFSSWLIDNPNIIDFFDDGVASKEAIELKIKTFVELRNDASHGDVVDLMSPDELKEYCVFVRSFMVVVKEFIVKDIVCKMENKKRVIKLGRVSEVFTSGAFILKVENEFGISVSSSVYVITKNRCYEANVNSIMLNDVSYNCLECLSPGDELGILCDKVLKKKAFIYSTLV